MIHRHMDLPVKSLHTHQLGAMISSSVPTILTTTQRQCRHRVLTGTPPAPSCTPFTLEHYTHRHRHPPLSSTYKLRIEGRALISSIGLSEPTSAPCHCQCPTSFDDFAEKGGSCGDIELQGINLSVSKSRILQLTLR